MELNYVLFTGLQLKSGQYCSQNHSHFAYTSHVFYPHAGSQGEGNVSAPAWLEPNPLPVSGKDKNIPFLFLGWWRYQSWLRPREMKTWKSSPISTCTAQKVKSHLRGNRGGSRLLLWEGAAIPLFPGTSPCSGCSSSAPSAERFLWGSCVSTQSQGCLHSSIPDSLVLMVSLPFPPSFHSLREHSLALPAPRTLLGLGSLACSYFIEKLNIILTNMNKPLTFGGHIPSHSLGSNT